MAGLVIDAQKCTLCGICVAQCPFSAMAKTDGKIEINAACKMCQLCIKNCPKQAIAQEKEEIPQIDKSLWHDILIYVEHQEGKIHPVTLELIGEGLKLASVIHQKVICLMIGEKIEQAAQQLLDYGVDAVDVYDDPQLHYFCADVYSEVFEDCIQRRKPTVVLVGATVSGRSVAPRVAVRFRTGLTADCTKLEMRENTDLVQIRPAFGGNIMAQILNTNHRPQFATVRYKVMEMAKKQPRFGQVVVCETKHLNLKSSIEILEVCKKEEEINISDAEILVVVGKGIQDEKTIVKLERLAHLLKGQIACTRPVVESGRYTVQSQIGLSGRTVKPKLIITFGVSGAIQFTASMKSSETIIAINKDPNAPIFELAHVAIVGDGATIVETMLKELEGVAV